jgi:hypothetical protein
MKVVEVFEGRKQEKIKFKKKENTNISFMT